MGIISKTVGLAALGAITYGAIGALGWTEGVNDRLRQAERVVSKYTGRPVSITVHDKTFRLTNYVVNSKDPTKLTLVTEFDGNPYDKGSAPKKVIFNLSDSSESIQKLRTKVDGLLKPDAKGIKSDVWCTINPPTAQELSAGRGIFEREYNNGLQWFTEDTKRIECQTYDQKKVDGDRQRTKPIF